jgi:hypothetical protein
MILYKPLNLLFIEVPKTGTESLEAAFSSLKSVTIKNFHPTLQECVDKCYIDPPLSKYKIFATIRNPYEKLLSLYLYRARQKQKSVSPIDFETQIVTGQGKLIDHPWQMRLQSDFLMYNSKEFGTWWCFDNLYSEFTKLNLGISLPHKNKSSLYNTADLVDIFYTPSLKQLVFDTWNKDFELYYKVKNGYKA